jgi:hypothetical protein
MKTVSPPLSTGRGAKIKNVIRVSSGNFLEMYDFIVFGYYAAAIGRTFFPVHNPYASLMLSLMTFGAGFLMRPVGHRATKVSMSVGSLPVSRWR